MAQEVGAEDEAEDALDDLDVADDLEDEAEDLEDDAAEDLEDAAEDLLEADDETLEEILDAVLGEDSGREEGDRYKRNKDADEKHLDDLESDIRYDKRHVRKEGEGSKGHEYGREDKDGKVGKRRGDKGGGKYGKGGHYKDYMQEDLVQEVVKRVRTRLAKMAKTKNRKA